MEPNILACYSGQPDVVGMHGGLPSPALFPISDMIINCVDPETAAQAAVGLSAPATHSEGDNVAPGRMAIAIQDESSVTAMQQYNLHMQGHGDLRAWLRKLLYRTQKPARDDLDLMLVPSCNASLDAFLHMLLDPGDSLLVEEHMYCAVRFLSLLGCTETAPFVAVPELFVPPCILCEFCGFVCCTISHIALTCS